MAELATSGTYVKVPANVWIDYRTGRVHVTSNDSAIPGKGMHLSARVGSKTEANLLGLLQEFDVPTSEAERQARHMPGLSDDEVEETVAQTASGSFERLLETAQVSAHHHRKMTWRVMYSLQDADVVADQISRERLWSGHENRIVNVAGDRLVETDVTYGPVWGGYAADLRRLFAKMGVQLQSITQLTPTCEDDCTHPSHRNGRI